MSALQLYKRYCDLNGWIKRDPLKGVERKREPLGVQRVEGIELAREIAMFNLVRAQLHSDGV